MALKMYEKVFQKVECNKEVKPQVTSTFYTNWYINCTRFFTERAAIQFHANNTLAHRNLFDEVKPIDETVNSHQFPTRLNYTRRIQAVHKVKKNRDQQKIATKLQSLW